MNAIYHGWPRTLTTVACEETKQRCVDVYGAHLRAIVLTGSLARGEATFFAEEQRWSLLGDAEFLLIFHEGFSLPPAVALEPLCRRIGDGLLKQNFRCHISLSAAYAGYLRQLKPAIFAYELKVCGHVIWGEESILSLIPAFLPSQIPPEDAWRLLCNRMIEQLEVVDEVGAGHLSRALYYRTIKLYLDMATSLLVFAGAYEASYRGRAEKLKMLADSALPDDEVPFPLRDFAERVLVCTRVKLMGLDRGGRSVVPGDQRSGVVFWEEAVTYAKRLWRWELAQLTGLRGDASDHDLSEGWRRIQPYRDRIRGWLSLFKRRGWLPSWWNWLSWGRGGWRASPRYWVYAAATELFFCLPQLVTMEGSNPRPKRDWEALHRRLPVLPNGRFNNGQPAWRQLASDIVWNYHQFLEDTRA